MAAVTAVLSPSGVETASVKYTSGGVVTSVVKPDQAPRTFVRRETDPGSMIVEVSEGDNVNFTRYELDASDRITRQVDALGGVQRWEYDDAGRLLKFFDKTGGGLAFDYDSVGHVVRRNTWITADTYTSQCYEYYETDDIKNGKLRSVYDPRSLLSCAEPLVSFEYDTEGRLTGEVIGGEADAEVAERTRYSYTEATTSAPKGQLAEIETPFGAKTTYQYRPDGLLASTTNAAGLETAYAYDTLGRATSVRTSGPGVVTGTTEFTWNDDNSAASIIEPRALDASGSERQLKHEVVRDTDGNVTGTRVTDVISGAKLPTGRVVYDSAGRVVTNILADGTEQTQAYDLHGRPSTFVDASGSVNRTEYDALSRPISTTVVGYSDPVTGENRDVLLNEVEYAASGLPERVYQVGAPVRHYTYQLDGSLTKITADGASEDEGSIVEFEGAYDALGNLVSQRTPAAAKAASRSFDAAGRILEEWTPAGVQYAYTYKPNGLTDSVTSYYAGDVVANEQFAYDAAGRVSSTTEGFGETTSTSWYSYDAAGRLTRSVDPRGSGVADSGWSTEYSYDALGDLTSVTYPTVAVSGEATRPRLKYAYDEVGRLEAIVSPNGGRQEVAYDEAGRIAEAREPSINLSDGTSLQPTTSWEYDPAGRISAETRPDGSTSRFEYDGLGRVIRRLDPPTTGDAPRASTIRWSDAGEPLEAIDASGRKRTWSYDAAGRVATSTVWDHEDAFTTSYDYDDAGRLVETTDPGGGVSSVAYDGRGLRSSATDADGVTATYRYDALGRPTRFYTDPWSSTIVEYNELGLPVKTSREDLAGTVLDASTSAYDKAGNVTSTSGPLGTGTDWTWDALNRVTSESYANGDSWALSYSDDGGLESVTDPLGNATRIERDALGRPTKVIEPSTPAHPALVDRTWITAYDIVGNPISETQPGGVSIERQFDVDGNLLHEVGSGGGALPAARTFTYDPVGRVLSASHPDGATNFEYDGRGLLTSSRGGAGDSTLAYDGNSRLTSWADEAGEGSATWTPGGRLKSILSGGSERRFGYDESGNLEKETGPDWSRTYRHDPLGRVTNVVATGLSSRYQWSGDYDQAGRLVEETIAPAQAAGAGTTTYRYDDLSRLVGWTGPDDVAHNQEFDEAGNLTSIDTRQFVYDERNRLVSEGETAYTWQANGDRATVSRDDVVTNYEFDGLGRLASVGGDELSYDALGRLATDGTSEFKYRGMDSEPVVTGSTSWQRLGAKILSSEGDVVVQNQRGDLVAREDATGGLASSNDYSPWGSSPGLARTLGFQGQWTTDQGLVHMQSRWYDPGSSSFVSRDSAKVPLRQANRYAYAAGNPVTGTDRTGQFAPPVLVAPVLAPAAAAAAASGPPGWLIAGAAVGTAAAGYTLWNAYQWSQQPGVPEFDYSPGTYTYSGASHGYSSPGAEHNYSSYPTTYGGTSYNYYGGTSGDFGFNGMNSGLNQMISGVNGANSAVNGMISAVNGMNSALDQMIYGINGMNAGFNQMNSGLNVMNSALDGMIYEINRLNSGVDQMISAINGINSALDQMISAVNGMLYGIDQVISGLNQMNFAIQSILDGWAAQAQARAEVDATPIYIRSSPGAGGSPTGTFPLDSAEICARADASLCQAVNAGTNVGHAPVDLKTTLVPRASAPVDPAGITGIRPAPTHYSAPQINQSAAYDYQRQHTGMLEFEVSGNGESIWADGVDGSTLVDTKFVTNPKSSPYTGTGPRFLQDGVREELRRYGEVIADPRTPYDSLELVTNDESAATFLGELLEEYDVPGKITLDP
ncbi:RHS repeat-associated core domain-containing protein [Isoptericola sp. NPDC056605]|uniref:RHS repeat-associated core domain-containing protein n=1 Tax=Isoptericola sp. NPDC056605 TaxID=3345876 RepID=UPI0036B3C97D